MAKNRRKRKETTAPSGETKGYAFIYWSELEQRYEMKIDNKLKAHTSGENKEEHDIGKDSLRKIAEVKGYTVLDA